MTKRKNPVEPEEISEGVRLTETATGMFRSQSVEVDVRKAGMRATHWVLASMFPKTPATLASELGDIEADARQVLASKAPPHLHRHAQSVLRMVKSLRVSAKNTTTDFVAIKAIELGKAAMAMMLRFEHEEGVAAASAAKAGRGTRFRKRDPEIVAEALEKYANMRARGLAVKVAEARIHKKYGIPPRTLRSYRKRG